jgi:hypothetical protein
MEEGNGKIERSDRTENQEIFSIAVRAGKRTYFFDVKSTRRNDYYLTITESKKRFHKDGRFYFEKVNEDELDDKKIKGYTNVEFEDLESVEATDKEETDTEKD